MYNVSTGDFIEKIIILGGKKKVRKSWLMCRAATKDNSSVDLFFCLISHLIGL